MMRCCNDPHLQSDESGKIKIMPIYLLIPDSPGNKDQIREIETKLKDIIPELRKIASIEDIAAEISGKTDTKIVVIFVSPVPPGTSVDNIINVANRYRHRIFMVLVSNEISGADYKRLIRSGGADWVAAKGSLQEVPELIYRQTLPAESSPQTDTKPTVVSFLPCLGGVGNTTVALEVALQIKLSKATRSWKVCYVDLDFQTSHVCDYLDVEARLQIQDILDRPERLDEQLFELFVSHHSSGLDVFAAPRNKTDPCEIDAAVLDPLLEMILQKYNYIILDLPVSWFSWTVPTLENSDAIIATGINTIPCLRQMKATLDAVTKAKVPSSKISIVMNRVTRRLIRGVERKGHVQSVFPNEKVFYVEEDSHMVERVNTGTPAALSGNQGKQFAKLASFCTSIGQTAKRGVAI
jgi:pilus assembly protein CpaE